MGELTFCYWAEADGERVFVPGCMTAAANPGLTKCLCGPTAKSLISGLEYEVRKAERALVDAKARLEKCKQDAAEWEARCSA